MSLGPRSRQELLLLARESLGRRVRGEAPLALPPRDEDDPLRASGGVFVTLRSDGQLRGCIGRTEGSGPLDLAVCQLAIAAGTQDPRFPAVQPDEIDGLTFEISVLTPTRPCSPDEVEIGVHGLIVSGFGRRGLLLPEVALDFGLDPQGFIRATCRKAGLPSDALEHGAELFCFRSEHFGEDDDS